MVLMLGAALAPLSGCRGMKSLEDLEPRKHDAVPLQVAKGLVYVPAVVLYAAVVVGVLVAGASAQQAAQHWATDRELGRDCDGDLGLRRTVWSLSD